MNDREKRAREQVEAARQSFITKATSSEFLTGEGAVIQQHLNLLVQPEVTLAQGRPELFILPPTAIVNLTHLSGDDRLLLTQPAREFIDNFSNPFREIKMDLVHREERPANGILFVSSPLRLAKNQWSALGLSINSDQGKIYPKINFEQTATGFRAEKHKSEFSQETIGKLYQTLVKTFEEKKDIANTDLHKFYNDMDLKQAYGDHMALLQLVEFPESIKSILPADKLALSPERLMTDEEYDNWKKFVDSLRTNPKRDNWGVNRFFTALSGTDLPVLHETWINPDGTSDNEITYIPLEVLDGTRRLGWQIGEILQFSNRPLQGRFIHGDKIRLFLE